MWKKIKEDFGIGCDPVVLPSDNLAKSYRFKSIFYWNLSCLTVKWFLDYGQTLQAIMPKNYDTRFFSIAFSDGTPKKAFLTACVVGTILTVINHGDGILIGEFPPLLKVLLTFCVPFCVTTWGSYLGKKSKILQQKKIDALNCN